MSVKVKIDGDAVDIIARRRKGIHDSAGNHRPADTMDSLTAERIGAAAEAAFSLRYDLPRPDADRINGDDGFDYRIRYQGNVETVEIKASAYADPSLMLSDSYRHDGVDRYVLGSVSWPTCVRFVGWIDAAEIGERASREPSQFGGWMDVVDSDDLDPLPPHSEVEVP